MLAPLSLWTPAAASGEEKVSVRAAQASSADETKQKGGGLAEGDRQMFPLGKSTDQ